MIRISKGINPKNFKTLWFFDIDGLVYRFELP